MDYTFSVDIVPEEDGKGYYVIVPALPGCFSQGRTIEEARKNIEKAISLHIQSLKRARIEVPAEGMAFQTAIKIAA